MTLTSVRKGFLFACWFIGVTLMYTPIITLVVYSFLSKGDHEFGSVLNTEAYRLLMRDDELLAALAKSVQIALFSATISVFLGGYAAISWGRLRAARAKSGPGEAGRSVADLWATVMGFLTMLPLLLPEIVFGIGLLVWFVMLRITLGTVSLILAHVTFAVSYVYLTVGARMQVIDPAIEDAAADLGASFGQILFRVYIPMLGPSLAAGWVMAFAISFDDFLISFFTAGPDTITLPLALYSSIKFGVSPSIFAMSTLVFVVSLLSATALTRLMLMPRGARDYK
jgi:spermidine/putrescine transport system permease protein